MSIRSTLDVLGTIVLVVCALVITGYVVFGRGESDPEPISSVLPDWERLVSLDRRLLGPETADDTLVVFSDFQCPFCRRAASMIDTLSSRRDILVIFRHFPLESHGQARTAALAAECARDVGRFREYHDLLFKQQDKVQKADWVQFARTVGIAPTAAFQDCISRELKAHLVDGDVALGESIGVAATPTFVAEGSLVRGLPNVTQLEALLNR